MLSATQSAAAMLRTSPTTHAHCNQQRYVITAPCVPRLQELLRRTLMCTLWSAPQTTSRSTCPTGWSLARRLVCMSGPTTTAGSTCMLLSLWSGRGLRSAGVPSLSMLCLCMVARLLACPGRQARMPSTPIEGRGYVMCGVTESADQSVLHHQQDALGGLALIGAASWVVAY